MKRGQSGFTLLETLIAAAISLTALGFAVRLLTNFANSYSQNREILESEGDLMNIERELRRYFDRAVGAAVTQSNPPGPTAGFALARSGAVVLVSDMRPCNTFNPLNSAAPGNRSQVRVSCCGPNQAITANVPGGGTVNVVSQCRLTNGLSIEVVRNGATTFSRCFSSVAEMDVAIAGFNDVTQSNVFYWNIAIPSGLTVGGNRAVAQQRSRLQLYLSPGFSGNQEVVTCQQPVGFGA